jgi:hypothetical protein
VTWGDVEGEAIPLQWYDRIVEVESVLPPPAVAEGVAATNDSDN